MKNIFVFFFFFCFVNKLERQILFLLYNDRICKNDFFLERLGHNDNFEK